jgi:predicted metalloprotease with PDZ domain
VVGSTILAKEVRVHVQGRRFAATIAVLGLLVLGGAAHAETLTYTLKPLPGTGRLLVEVRWQTAGRAASRLCISEQWGMVSDVAGLLRDVDFSGGEARRAGNCWDIRHAQGATLTCCYTVEPGRTELDWAHQHHPVATAGYFHGIGNTFLVGPATRGSQPEEYEFVVRWKLPEGWRAICSWGAGPTVGARLHADAFRHGVYLAGENIVLEERRFALAGQEQPRALTVATCGEFGFTADELAAFASDLIRTQAGLVGTTDFPAFVITALALGQASDEGRLRIAGTGLHHSLALFVPPQAALGEELEHIFAHELFHHWNGGLLRAAEPFQAVYWFTEGLTDYYALRSLYEAGRWDAATLAKWLNRHLREYATNPARNASNEEIQAEYWKKRDTVGEVPYQRGLLLGLRWTALARENNAGGNGVDRLFAALLARAEGDADFRLTNVLIREVGVATLGAWFAGEFDEFVERAATIDVPKDALAPVLRARRKAVYEYELGFAREQSLADERIRSLVADSAAARAGLREGDKLAGWKIVPDPDQKTVLQVRRGAELKTISYFPRGAKLDVLQFQAVSSEARKEELPS